MAWFQKWISRQASNEDGAMSVWVDCVLSALLAIVLVVIASQAFGHDASEPDAAWFNSLEQPQTHINCCGSDHDCRAYDDADVAIRDGVYYVHFRQEWLEVPKARMVDRTDNPTGHFVACVHDMGAGPLVLCAVRGTGA